jgi:hypothetical protein
MLPTVASRMLAGGQRFYTPRDFFRALARGGWYNEKT